MVILCMVLLRRVRLDLFGELSKHVAYILQ